MEPEGAVEVMQTEGERLLTLWGPSELGLEEQTLARTHPK